MRRTQSRRCRPDLTTLEGRSLLAFDVSASLSAGLLDIVDPGSGDAIRLRQVAGQVSVDGVSIRTPTGTAASVPATSVERISIRLNGGKSQVFLDTLLAAGARQIGPVTVQAGAGADLIRFGAGRSFTIQASQSLAVSPNQGVVASLDLGGNLVRVDYAANASKTIATGVSRFEYGANGTISFLTSDRRLIQYGATPGTGVLAVQGVWPDTAEFALARSGVLFRRGNDGLLQEVSANATARYVSSGVSHFELGGGKLFWLEGGGQGNLFERPEAGASYSLIASTVRQFAVSDDRLYWIDGGAVRRLMQRTVAGGDPSLISSSASRFETADRRLYWLEGDAVGRLYEKPVGGAVRQITSSVRQFQAADGRLYWIEGGSAGKLYEQPAGGNYRQISSSVSRLQADDGRLYWLEGGAAGNLYEQAVGANYSKLATGVTQFQSADGRLYWIQDAEGKLFEKPVGGTGRMFTSSVSRFETADGRIYWLEGGTAGRLYEQTPGATYRLITSSVSQFQTADGRIYWIEGGTAGRLYEQRAGTTYRQISSTVSQMIAADGRLYWIEGGAAGRLYEQRVGFSYRQISSSVSQMIAADARLYWIEGGSAGRLYEQPAGSTYRQISSSVSQMVAADARLYWIEGGAAARLYEQPVGSGYRQISSSVSQMVAADARLYWIEGGAAGRLYEQPVNSNYRQISSSVIQIQAGGEWLYWVEGVPGAYRFYEKGTLSDYRQVAGALLTAGGTLYVSGTAQPDTIALAGVAWQIKIDGVRLVADSRAIGWIPSDRIDLIVINGNDGSDTIRLDGGPQPITIPAFIDGGPGNDMIYGGAGNDYLNGGPGNDGLFGGIGADILRGDTGADRFLANASRTSAGIAYGGDALQDVAGEDAIVRFYSGAKNWTDAEITLVDSAFDQLVEATGNTTLLKLARNVPGRDRMLDFYRQATNGDTAGDNNSAGTINLYSSTFAATSDWTCAVVIHEIGHNWDTKEQGESNPFWGAFVSIRNSGAGYVRSYAQTSVYEDFAESLAEYFRPKAYEGRHVGSETIIARKRALIGRFVDYL